MKFRILLFLLLGCKLFVIAQNTAFRKYKYVWGAIPTSSSVHAEFSGEDAVILDDTLTMAIGATEIHRHVRIKYQTENGIRRFSVFKLPESVDPDDERLTAPLKELQIKYEKSGTYNYVDHFSARIIRSDGSVVPAVIKDSTAERIEPNYGRALHFFIYYFRIENLQIGDELELDYVTREEVGFTSFEEKRVFFHGPLARQSYYFSIIQPSNYPYIFINNNGSRPIDTVMGQDNTIKWVWSFTDLPEYGNLSGAILNKDLPYVIFYKHNARFGLLNSSGTAIKEYSPYTWDYKFQRYAGYRTSKPEKYTSPSVDEPERVLNEMFRDLKQKHGDSVCATLVKDLHESVNDSFTYEGDKSIASTWNDGSSRLPRYLKEHVLKEYTTRLLYKGILSRMNVDYELMILRDRRLHRIDPRESPSGPVDRFGYGFSCNGAYFFVIPKLRELGYRMNEFPFYYENELALMVPQNLPYSDYVQKKEAEVGFVAISANSGQDNVRNTSIRVAVSLGNNVADFSARVNLMGQYSTMMRGYYLKGYVDSSVSEKYHQRVCDIGADVNVSELEKVSEEKDFPFKTVFKSIYTKNKLLKELSPNEYALSMRNWFNHIIPDDFSAKGRLLSYYPDFKGTDTYKYLIEFDQPVTLLNAADFKTDIQNVLGRLTINVEQYQPNAILVESYFLQKTDRLPADQAKDAEAIFTAIRKLNELPLRIKK